MPISFPSDNSSQVGGSLTSGSIYYAVVNQCNLDITSNILKTYIDTKQNILTSATNLVGIGSLITQLNVAFKENPDGYLDSNELADVDQSVVDRYQSGLYTAEEVPKGQVKEDKANKLRQRINELRGVYV